MSPANLIVSIEIVSKFHCEYTEAMLGGGVQLNDCFSEGGAEKSFLSEQKLRRNRMHSMRTCDLSLVAECRDQCDQAVDKSFVVAHTGDVHQRTSRGTEAF
jgi:hypothetical protein